MSKKIKILQIIPNLERGGAERICLELSQGLGKNNFSLAALLFKDSSLDSPEKSLLRSQGIEIFSLKKRSRVDFKNWRAIFKVIKSWQPDLVHTHLGGDIYGVLAAKLAGVKTVITTEHNVNQSERRLTSWLKTLSLLFVDQVVAVSQAVQADALDRYHLNPDKLTVVYNGISDQFLEVNKRSISSPITLGTLGRLSPQKGLNTLIEAVSLSRQSNYQLLIGGAGELKEDLEAQIARLNLSDRIKLLGLVEPLDFFSQIDIFVLSSHWEGFGLVALEAGAQRRPLIVSQIDGLAEIVDSERAYFFPPQKASALAEKIDYLIDNLESAEVLAKVEKNYQYIKENFSVDKMITAYQDLYLNLIN